MKKVILLLISSCIILFINAQTEKLPANKKIAVDTVTVLTDTTPFISKQGLYAVQEVLRDISISQRNYEFIVEQLAVFTSNKYADTVLFITLTDIKKILDVFKDLSITPRVYQNIQQIFINMINASASEWQRKKKKR